MLQSVSPLNYKTLIIQRGFNKRVITVDFCPKTEKHVGTLICDQDFHLISYSLRHSWKEDPRVTFKTVSLEDKTFLSFRDVLLITSLST